MKLLREGTTSLAPRRLQGAKSPGNSGHANVNQCWFGFSLAAPEDLGKTHAQSGAQKGGRWFYSGHK